MRILIIALIALLILPACPTRYPMWHPSDIVGKKMELVPLNIAPDERMCGKLFFRDGSLVLFDIMRHGLETPMRADFDNIVVELGGEKPVVRYIYGEKNMVFTLPYEDYYERCVPQALWTGEEAKSFGQEFRLYPVHWDTIEPCGEYFTKHLDRNGKPVLRFVGAFPFGFSIPWGNIQVLRDNYKTIPTAEMPNRTSVILRMSDNALREAACLTSLE